MLLLNPTQNRLQGHSFNFNYETTTVHCSLPMLTCPSDEVGPSPRWCCAELANPAPPPTHTHTPNPPITTPSDVRCNDKSVPAI